MRAYMFTHFSDAVLLRHLAELFAKVRSATSTLLACIAEVDARRLYLAAGYPSMYAYCVGEFGLSDQAAFKRIRVARTARQFPAIFVALAEGRLNMTAVVLLASHLTEETADELLAAIEHKTKSEIEQLLAQRFPRPDVPARVQPISEQLSPGTVSFDTTELLAAPAPGVEPPRPKVSPLSPQRFALQLTMGQSMHDKLRHAQALLSHQIPSGDVTQVLERALDVLICKLEKTKFAATEKPRPPRHSSRPRHVPAHVRRAVWKRDEGQCTFIGETGHRCKERKFLEYDHVDPVARGGEATVERMRLRCRAHNQYEAECAFGAEFMDEKRNEAGRRAAEARVCDAAAKERAAVETLRAAAKAQAKDVFAGLRELGFRANESRRAAEYSETLHDATLEDRMRLALVFLCPKPRLQSRVETGVGGASLIAM